MNHFGFDCWHAYCSAWGRGIRNPGDHSEEFLGAFITEYRNAVIRGDIPITGPNDQPMNSRKGKSGKGKGFKGKRSDPYDSQDIRLFDPDRDSDLAGDS